ncbi:tag-314, partial [Pristionchus pacificus]|uniref:IBR domain-containing protein n=1 Tax=Pristionchus pacificus TaxID=54126 RepID=A0A8R1V5N9_PRIPA
PSVQAIYSEVRECHLVMCANTRCRTQFCWVCGHPVKNLNHFAGSFCRIGYDDLYRGVYLLRFIYSTSLPVLILLFPWILTLLFVLFPFSIIFALPIALSIQIYKSA